MTLKNFNHFKEIKDIEEIFQKNKKRGENIMNKTQERQILKGIYSAAIETMVEAVENRRKALRQYEQYLYTVEQTIQVFNPDFNIERDLKLPSRGIDEDTLRYVTVVDRQSQREQLDFYQDIKSTL